ncbi:formyl transferase [Colwelliaceae bacterium 6471]
MNIVILANKDIASNFALNLLLPRLTKHKISVFLSSKVGNNTKKPAQLKSLAFFEQSLLNELLSPLLEATPTKKALCLTFKQLASLLSRPIEELNHINSPDGFEKINACEPDLILSIRYGVILKAPILSLAKFGVLNLHSGSLPQYRGVMATFWAMLNDEETIGTTLHYIDDNTIDTGRVLAQSTLSINKQHCYLWHVLQLYKGGCELLELAVNQITQGIVPVSYYQESDGDYYTFPTENDLTSFNKKGYSLINEDELLAFYQTHYCPK